ncbi:conserved hypothetical protein [Yersinia pestis KIM D27]|nr:conserved hypothetical protein [Yersinia pestis KIM D27]
MLIIKHEIYHFFYKKDNKNTIKNIFSFNYIDFEWLFLKATEGMH